MKEVLKDNRKELEVILLDPEDDRYTGKTINIDNYKIKKVKNSFGQIEKRFLIKTMMTLGDQQFKAGFTLSDRGKMKNNVLLGRKILAGRFLVDVEEVNLTKAE